MTWLLVLLTVGLAVVVLAAVNLAVRGWECTGSLVDLLLAVFVVAAMTVVTALYVGAV